MDNLLDFLNTADIETLTRIPGITQTIAENLVAARPFNSVEDCLEVKGMGKKVVARIQDSLLPTTDSMPDESAMIPVEPDSIPLDAIQPLKETASPEKPSFRTRLQTSLLMILRAILRLILLVLLIGIATAVIYFGLPWLRETYIAPVEQNAARVSQLESEVADLKNQLKDIHASTDKINNRVDELDTAIQAHTASLEKLEAMQNTLEKQLKEANNQTLLEIKREIKLTRALDTLARARLYLAESNFGLAKADVQSARDMLADLEAESGNEVLAQAISRLDIALSNLPSFPVVASNDLEIAWQILITGQSISTGIPQLGPGFTPTPQSFSGTTTIAIPTIESTPTSTPQPTLEVTATATP